MATTKTAAATKVVEHNDGLIPIFIPSLPDEGGSSRVDQDIVVTVNGKNTIVRRGVHCEVPIGVYESLYNSGRFERL